MDSAIFTLATRFAKALAQIRSDAELTVDVMLAGLLVAAMRESSVDGAALVLGQKDAISARLKSVGIDVGDDLVSAVAGRLVEHKVPVGSALRDCIKAANGDVGAFLSQLLGRSASGSFPDNKFVKLAMPWIAAYARHLGEAEVSCDAFGAGAFIAFEAGVFREFPGISSVFSVNRPSFEVLISRKFNGLRSVTPIDGEGMIATSALRQALSDGDSEGQRFVTAVHLGMRTGSNLLEDERTAFHEAGHAVVSAVLRPGIPVSRVIVKREKDYVGVTVYDGTAPDSSRWRREDYLVRLCIFLAGRAAQSIKFGDDQMDCGASDDLRRATEYAWKSIADLGLDPVFGPLCLSALSDKGVPASGWIVDEAQRRLQAVMKEAETRTEAVLSANWPRVEILAQRLIASGEVDFEEFVSSLALRGLGGLPGVVRVENLPVERDVLIVDAAGSHATPEGHVRYDVGDAIVKGERGDSWPVARATFCELYEPVAGTVGGKAGRYRKKSRGFLAMPLLERSRVDLSDGRGVLTGGAGDWIVDYGKGDLAIVRAEAFSRLYRVIDQPQ
jgi:hypothetical protein